MSNNNKKFTLRLLFVYIGITIVTIILFNAIYNSSEKTLKMDYGKKKLLLVSNWENETKNRKIRWKQEQRKVCGEGVEGIAKDPDIEITQMLDEITRECIPPRYLSEIKIENFTEFNIFITLPEIIDKKSTSLIVKNILSYCSKYVYSINFVYQDNIVKIFNKQAIDRIQNWKNADLSTISDLFTTP